MITVIITNLGAPGSGRCVCQQAVAQFTTVFATDGSPLLAFNLCSDCKDKLTTAVTTS